MNKSQDLQVSAPAAVTAVHVLTQDCVLHSELWRSLTHSAREASPILRILTVRERERKKAMCPDWLMQHQFFIRGAHVLLAVAILLHFTYSEREKESGESEREIKMPSIIHKYTFIPPFSELHSDWTATSSFQQVFLSLDGPVSLFFLFSTWRRELLQEHMR